MTARFKTTAGHRRSFERAPRVRAGDRVQRIRDDDKSPGWFFGSGPDGVEGYFPTSWFEIDPDGTTARALRDYDAMELTIEGGVDVECLAEAVGWLLVRTVEEEEGWIPVSCKE